MPLLLLEFWLPVALCLLTVLLGETDILPCGILAPQREAEFWSLLVMEPLTLLVIPLALWLFRRTPVRRSLAGSAAALRRWGSVRILMLALPMVADTAGYYLFMHPGFGYMAIILLLSLLFVYPSASRCAQETGAGDDPTDLSCQK